MSPRFTTITEAEQYILGYSPEKRAGETYTLERMKTLMHHLGNPQNKIPAVHVAGTSGKTSTAYFIRWLLQAHGQRTGLTTSPHIASITERVQVDGVPLADDTFMSYLDEFIGLIEDGPDLHPTYFELLTAFAFWVFSREHVDYMVIEVGLGGLLDATNVIDGSQKVSVITPIGLDHTDVLGNTVGEIANQKAGIVNTDSVVFTIPQAPEAYKIISTVAANNNTRLIDVRPTRDTSLPMPLFQQDNFSLARTVVAYIAERDNLKPIHDAAINQAITATPPGRFEVYEIQGKTIVLDGAHNPQKLSAFLEALRHRYDGPYAWLIGFVSAPEKKIDDCIDVIANQNDRYIATQFSIGQDIKGRTSTPAANINEKMAARNCDVATHPNPNDAFDQLLNFEQRVLVVTGSLYIVAQLRGYAASLATTR